MAKVKKKKYIVYSIVGILVVLVVLNWGNIKFVFDMMSSYKKYEEVKDIPDNNKETFKDSNPILEAIEKNNENLNEEDTNTNVTNEGEGNSNNENNDKENNINNKDNVIYLSILSNYNDKFTSLQNAYEEALNSMISQGYSEYKNGTVSKSKLVSKYMSKGKSLENESDAKVNALVKEMENELKSNGFDPSVAKEVKNYYNSYKENRRGEVMAKAFNAID
ncbi:hypothetical protein [Anaerosalibacter sp. Marseille-P3206]|uniref:hypothetical protein n=1 Tax=Anaerosalibacter sp. Marseille-P3206 TaxID=1871005 RepID=UPI000985933A|nr:hypothetical protein [Anaerosalibacter sp. Marseille-P3206]